MFIVEDGTARTDANSYLSVEEADNYHSLRGNEKWTSLDAVAKKSALVKATDYIEETYNDRWMGKKVKDSQSLSWPRFMYPLNSDEIPLKLRHATCKLALETLSGDLNPTLDRDIKSEKVDVIETVYMDNSPSGKRYPAICGLLKAYINGGRHNCKVRRV